ncbi:MAG: metal ABC transporter permease [Sulfurovum sp.]|nr:metal ABC transporter permease [Sulfurovum sp.]MDD3602073.1 metal ABC transporter permease [Sulfurovum sp.]
MSVIALLWPALALSILLVFIHALFGLEIIKRGVIFTDLAIGQVAAVGTALSIAFWGGAYQQLLTLFFALMAALVITVASRKIKQIEAFIGLLYALGISSMMLILAQSSEGMELFNKLSAADILFSTQEDVIQSLWLYGMIAFVMFMLYPRLSGLYKELLFFGALALTVTSSVQNAGVLVVFALLIAPAYAAFAQKRFNPLYFAWVFGAINILFSLFISYFFDLPTGYTMIFVLVLCSLLTVSLLLFKNL